MSPVDDILRQEKNRPNEKNPVIRVVLLTIASLITLFISPFMLWGAMLSLSPDSNNQYFLIAFLGYVIFTVSLIISIFRPKMLRVCLLGCLIFLAGNQLDHDHVSNDKADDCKIMRQDDYCIETESGFRCTSPSPFGNMVIPENPCPQQLSEAEREIANAKKLENRTANAKAQGTESVANIADTNKVMQAIEHYETIVRTIIASNAPQSLNFEKKLMAIHNCLNTEYGSSARAEEMARNTLHRIIKTDAEKNNYVAYLESKGRFPIPGRIVAGLPAGDQSLGCANISTK